VINVEGRTHPVSTHFLEDVYEKMEYCLELDSPASGAYFAQHGEKVLYSEFSHLIVCTFFICWSHDYYCLFCMARTCIYFCCSLYL
jgi:hypothetical protein